MNQNARILVTYYPPRFGKPIDVCFDIDPFEAEPYNPLPRDRELYGAPIISGAFSNEQREELKQQLMGRDKLTKYLAPRLADALAKIITGQDTVNGYAPEELKR